MFLEKAFQNIELTLSPPSWDWEAVIIPTSQMRISPSNLLQLLSLSLSRFPLFLLQIHTHLYVLRIHTLRRCCFLKEVCKTSPHLPLGVQSPNHHLMLFIFFFRVLNPTLFLQYYWSISCVKLVNLVHLSAIQVNLLMT